MKHRVAEKDALLIAYIAEKARVFDKSKAQLCMCSVSCFINIRYTASTSYSIVHSIILSGLWSLCSRAVCNVLVQIDH